MSNNMGVHIKKNPYLHRNKYHVEKAEGIYKPQAFVFADLGESLQSCICIKNLRGSSKSAHAWISIIFCMLNTYVITTTKMKSFHSSKAVRLQGGTLMYTLFVLIYNLLKISLKSLTLLTATFFKWNMKEDFPGYTILQLMYMNTSR